MIWDILQQSSFNNYFQKPQLQTLTMQTLLLDENIITEFKNMNPSLIAYIEQHRAEFVSKLIHYSVTMPSQNDTEERIKKLPYVSSELLSIDNQIIYDSLLQNQEKDYFAQLIEIFESDACKNQILMGYFVKVVTNLYKCQKKKTMKKIYEKRSIFCQHLQNQGVGSILKMFVILLQTEDGFMLNERKQVVRTLIEQLSREKEEIRVVCKNILAEVIAKFQTFSSGDQIKDEIMSSEKILSIFQIANSQAIDDFIIGYLTKALQKICTASDQDKSLLQILPIHRQKLTEFIKIKKSLLTSPKELQSFVNQTKNSVDRFKKQLYSLIQIMKLSLQNSITDFLNQEDIPAFFSILYKHKTNDIIKVRIFGIFNLILSKKNHLIQQALINNFESKAVILFQQDKQMFGYFLYQFWKNIQKKIPGYSLNLPENKSQKWGYLLKYFDQNQKYEKEAKKVVDMYSNRTKILKLVVDEQDTAGNTVRQNQKSTQKTNETLHSSISQNQIIQKIQSLKIQSPEKQTKQNSFEFDFLNPKPVTPEVTIMKIQVGNKKKLDPFSAFDFFTNSIKKQEKTEEDKQENKKKDFSDFASFF